MLGSAGVTSGLAVGAGTSYGYDGSDWPVQTRLGFSFLTQTITTDGGSPTSQRWSGILLTIAPQLRLRLGEAAFSVGPVLGMASFADAGSSETAAVVGVTTSGQINVTSRYFLSLDASGLWTTFKSFRFPNPLSKPLDSWLREITVGVGYRF